MGLDDILGRTLQKLSRNEKFTPYLEKAIAEANWPEEYAIKVYNKERIWDGMFHPSSDAAASELFLYYKFSPKYALKHERWSPSSLMTLQIGSAIHALIESMLVHLGFTEEKYCEVTFTNEEHNCTGTIDVERVFLPDGSGETPPIEIKSCSQIPNKPQANHILQLQPYLDMGCETPQDYGLILYVEKAYPHRVREFTVERDQEQLDQIYAKWAKVRKAIEMEDGESLFERNCCNAGSKTHHECPARFVCRLGPPTPGGL
jgi:hypothetical protein